MFRLMSQTQPRYLGSIYTWAEITKPILVYFSEYTQPIQLFINWTKIFRIEIWYLILHDSHYFDHPSYALYIFIWLKYLFLFTLSLYFIGSEILFNFVCPYVIMPVTMSGGFGNYIYWFSDPLLIALILIYFVIY